MNNIYNKYFIEKDVLMVHKPVGISSFQLVSKIRKLFQIKKVGHAGTLDPLASGLMIVGLNSGTKKMSQYLGLDKVYITEILIGKSTVTGDLEGSVLSIKPTYQAYFSEEYFYDTLRSMLGVHLYKAPLYSAVKVLGKPLYRYAREGKKPPFIPEKEMNFKSFQILDFYESGEFYVLKLRLEVGSGTYIRTLAEEFGKNISYPACIKSLYRVSIDNYLDRNAYRFKKE